MSSSTAPEKQHFATPPRILVIGAGSRGTTYAQWTKLYTNAIISGICEPIAHKRRVFVQRFMPEQRSRVYADRFIAPEAAGTEEQHAWAGWREWVVFERARRARAAAGEAVQEGVDAVFVCVLDEMHAEVVCTLAKMGVHLLVEKPLSTRLESCVGIFNALREAKGNVEVGGKKDADSLQPASSLNSTPRTLSGLPLGILLRACWNPHQQALLSV